MPISHDDKYDEAIAYLREQDPGSYFDECADLIEELLGRVYELEEELAVERAEAPEVDDNPIAAAVRERNARQAAHLKQLQARPEAWRKNPKVRGQSSPDIDEDAS